MPAKSEAQRRLFAVALHNPEKLYSKNKGLASLSKETLHDFAASKSYRDHEDKPKPRKRRKTYGEGTMLTTEVYAAWKCLDDVRRVRGNLQTRFWLTAPAMELLERELNNMGYWINHRDGCLRMMTIEEVPLPA